MAQMKTLTVNGKTYAVTDPNAANALKGAATGNPVRITDCSPREHELAVRADTPFATVTRYGKNLVDMNDWVAKGAAAIAEDGSYYIDIGEMYNAYGRPETDKYMYIPENGAIPLTWTVTYKKDSADVMGGCFGIVFEYTDGTKSSRSVYGKIVDGVSQWTTEHYSSDPGKTIAVVRCTWATYRCYIKEFHMETGATATPYEPYAAPVTCAADENGEVKGVMSVCPTTTLIAGSGVTLSAQYNKDTNKVVESLVNAIVALGGDVRC